MTLDGRTDQCRLIGRACELSRLQSQGERLALVPSGSSKCRVAFKVSDWPPHLRGRLRFHTMPRKPMRSPWHVRCRRRLGSARLQQSGDFVCQASRHLFSFRLESADARDPIGSECPRVPGDDVTVPAKAPVNGSYKAVVTVVHTVVDWASGTFDVRLQLPSPK